MDLGQVAASAGPWALSVGFIFSVLYSIASGKLVPGSTVDRLTTQWEARLQESHDREKAWQTAHDRTVEAFNVNAQQLGELMVLARTTDAVLRALPIPGGGRSDDA